VSILHPRKTEDGKTTSAVLNWRDGSHYNGGRTGSCVSCGSGTWLLNDSGQPQHKVCAEAELARPEGGDR
jgi:hypothetical protein